MYIQKYIIVQMYQHKVLYIYYYFSIVYIHILFLQLMHVYFVEHFGTKMSFILSYILMTENVPKSFSEKV